MPNPVFSIDRPSECFEVCNAICPSVRGESASVRNILQFDKYVCAVLEDMKKAVKTIQSKNQRFLAFQGTDCYC